LFLYCNTISFLTVFYIYFFLIRIPRHGPHLTINHWRSNRRIINKLILAQCNINRQKKDNYWYYCNKFYLIDNSNNNKCNKRCLFNMKFIKIGKETGKCYKVTVISRFIVVDVIALYRTLSSIKQKFIRPPLSML
jgi:hypothetical protein